LDCVLSYHLLYRLGFTPWDNAPGPRVLDRVLAGDSAGAGRRALDVGCGKGRDAIHLAKKGWEVTAVDLEERAIGKARERAAEAGADVHWVVGDVTQIGTLAAPPGYSLIYDLGCIHGLPDEAAALAAEGITSLAAADATLLWSPSPAAAG
jgi:SAM-dependent methyltransferase